MNEYEIIAAIALYLIIFYLITRLNRKSTIHDEIISLETNRMSNIIFLVDGYWDRLHHISDRIIDIDDDEKFMEEITRIEMDPNRNNKPLELVIYAHGGSVASSDKIVEVLLMYTNEVYIHIPAFAFSAGSMVALCGDIIYMNKYSLMSPVDPQITYFTDKENEDDVSTRCLLDLLEGKTCDDKIDVNDNLYLKALESKYLHDDNLENLRRIVNVKNIGPTKSRKKKLVKEFGSGMYPHHKPFNIDKLRNLGLTIEEGVPYEINFLFNRLVRYKNSRKSRSFFDMFKFHWTTR